MSRHLDRLRRGERWWAAEIALRLAGLAMLASFYRVVLIAHNWVIAAPRHSVGLAIFALCAVSMTLFSAGLGFLFEGPGLFRMVPIPRKSAYF